MGRWVRLLPGLVLSACLAGCVTESTGGFSEGSEAEALENYLLLSAGYLEQGDLASARRHLGNALAIDPRSSDAHGIQALIYSRQGDLELADASFRRAISLNGRNSQARNNYAAFLYAHDRFREAFEQLQEVVEDTAYPRRPGAFAGLGMAALRLERPEDAENAFNRALQLDPQNWRASLELAGLNLQQGDVLQARQFYRNFLALSQFYNLAQSERSLWIGIQLESALGNERNAEEYALELEERFPRSEEFQLYLNSVDDE